MIWREPARGGLPDPSIFGLSGLEQLRAFLTQGGPIPPIGRLFGMRFTEAGPGTATFTMPATPWLQAPQGAIPPGVLLVLADAALGSAVQSELPPATPYTTQEISLSALRPAVPDGGLLVSRGRLISAGRSLALAEMTVEDEGGRLLAHGTTRCYVFPTIEPAPAPPDELVPLPPPLDLDTDPWTRPVEGEVLPQEVWDEMSGLDILRRCAEGSLPAPPLYHLTGLRPTEVSEGRATFVLPATLWLASPAGTVEGGAVAMLADVALSSAVQTTVPAGTAFAPFDLKVNFLRPVHPDGRDLAATGTVLHRGRTIAVASAEVTNAEGKPVAMAMGSAMILPGRPASIVRPVVLADEGAAPEAG